MEGLVVGPEQTRFSEAPSMVTFVSDPSQEAQPVKRGAAITGHVVSVTPAVALAPTVAVPVIVWAPAPTLHGTVNVALNAPAAVVVTVPRTTGADWIVTVTDV